MMASQTRRPLAAFLIGCLFTMTCRADVSDPQVRTDHPFFDQDRHSS